MIEAEADSTVSPATITVGKLLIIAGPTACGKSTLIRQLCNHAAATTFPFLPDDLSAWPALEMAKLRRRAEQAYNRLVVHVDTKSFWLKDAAMAVRNRNTASLLQRASKVTCLTLFLPPSALLERLASRTRDRGSSRQGHLRKSWKPSNYDLLQAFYRDETAVRDHYEAWLNAAAAAGVRDHWLIDNSSAATKVWRVEEWLLSRASER
jgi:guanylate kinase